MLLADLGAEVLKIEQPGTGDYLRFTPPMMDSQSAMFLTLNRNKKSLTLNLKSDKGKEIFRKLLERSDVLVESFRPGIAKKLGIDYETLSRAFPRIIYCSITGFGQDGPYRNLVGHDINYLALSGVLSLTGERDGPPVVPGIPLADIAGSMFGVIGILSSLISREKTGRGQFIDISMFDGAISWLTIQAARYFASGKQPERGTFPSGGEPFYTVYETSDGKHVAVGSVEEKFWQSLCEAVGASDISQYRNAGEEKMQEARSRLSDIFKTKTRDDWFALLRNKDVCVAPVKTLDEVFSDPQVRHRSMIFEMEYPEMGRIKQLGFPVKYSEAQQDLRVPPPMLGEHTESVLVELGYTRDQIQQFAEEGVL